IWTRVQSPERPSTRSGADGASVPVGGPSGARYSTVRRADSTRLGSDAPPLVSPRLTPGRWPGVSGVLSSPGLPPEGSRAAAGPAEPGALRVAVPPRDQGAPGEARQALAARFLEEPSAVGGDAVTHLGGQRCIRRGRREPQDNW